VADGFTFQGQYDVLWCSQIVWGKTKTTAWQALQKLLHLARKRIFIITDVDAIEFPSAFSIGDGLSAVVDGPD